MVVPAISLVNGMIATKRIRKGTDLRTFIIIPTKKFIILFGLIPFLSVINTIMPRGIPIIYAASVEIITM